MIEFLCSQIHQQASIEISLKIKEPKEILAAVSPVTISVMGKEVSQELPSVLLSEGALQNAD
jgi:hypothetical protein